MTNRADGVLDRLLDPVMEKLEEKYHINGRMDYLHWRRLAGGIRRQARGLTRAQVDEKTDKAERTWAGELEAERREHRPSRGDTCLDARYRFTEWQRIQAVMRRNNEDRYNPERDNGEWPPGEHH